MPFTPVLIWTSLFIYKVFTSLYFFKHFMLKLYYKLFQIYPFYLLNVLLNWKPRNLIYDHIHSLYLQFLDPLLAAITNSRLFEYDSTSLAHRSLGNSAHSSLQNFSSSIKPWDLHHVPCAPWSKFWSRISLLWILSGCAVQKAKGSFPLEIVTW